MADEELRLVISAEDQFSAATDKAVASLEAIAGQADAAQKALEDMDLKLPPLDTSELDTMFDGLHTQNQQFAEDVDGFKTEVEAMASATEEATPALEGMSEAFEMLKTAGGAFIGFETLKRAAGEWLEQGDLGASLINLGNGFDTAAEKAGASGPAMLAQIMAVGRGILDDDEAMREFILTTRAAGSGIAAEWPKLIQVAMASTAQGIGSVQGNLEQLDQYIRTGFGRGLKQMGIMVPDAGPMMEAYAASLGTTADKLTEAEQAQARMNAVLTTARMQFGDLDVASAKLAGGGITSLRNSIEDLGETAATAAAPGIDAFAASISGILIAANPAIAKLAELYAWQEKVSTFRMPEGIGGGAAGLGGAAATMLPFGDLLGRVPTMLSNLGADWLAPALEKGTPMMAMLGGELEEFAANNEDAIGAVARFAESLGLIAPPAQEAATATREVRTEAELWQSVGLEMVNGTAAQAAAQAEATAADEARAQALERMAGDLDGARQAADGRAKTARYEADAFHGVGDAYEEAARTGLHARDVSTDLAPAMDAVADAASRVAANVAQANAMLAGFGGSLEDAQRNATTLYTLRQHGAATTAGGEPLDFLGVQAPWEARDTVQDILQIKIDSDADALAFAEETARKGAAAGVSAWNDQEAAMKRYYDTWESEAMAALAPTQAIDQAALDLAAGIPRAPAFDENARRAADVVNLGAASPWATQAGMTNPQEAAQYIEDFYAGKLAEDQYNWDAAIANIEQQRSQASGQQWMLDVLAGKVGMGGAGGAAGVDLDAALGMGATAADSAALTAAGMDAATAFGDQYTAAMASYDFRGPAETAARGALAGWTAGIKSPADTTAKALFGVLWPLIAAAIAEQAHL